MVLKWATEFRQPCAINAVRQLPGATSIFNAELHAILLALDVVRRSKEKHFLLLSDSYSSLIALGGSHVDQDAIYKYLKTYSTITNSGTNFAFWYTSRLLAKYPITLPNC